MPATAKSRDWSSPPRPSRFSPYWRVTPDGLAPRCLYNLIMPAALKKKFTLNDLRSARAAGIKIPMLTCYDFTMAKLMHEAGVPAILVGDSAANVVLGHETTLPMPLHFMIQIAAAVRRGAPQAFVVADMPFGSYQGSPGRAMRSVFR